MSQAIALSDADVLRLDRRVSTLIGLSHGASHFYQLALPPLFVLINAAEGISFTRLGILTGTFYVTSALCQPPSGFLVDRFGARVVLLSGLALMAGSTALMGVVAYYPVMLVLSLLAGAGNSVFHPCDYSIMNATVSEKRIARAFSFHMFGGYIGYAMAPLAMTAIGTYAGWRPAIVLAGLIGLLIFACLWRGSRDFRDSSHDRKESGDADETLGDSIRMLINLPIILCWIFFLIIAMGIIGLQTFTPALLKDIYGFDLETGGAFVTVMLFGVTIGVLCGGYLADYLRKPDRVVMWGYSSAVLVVIAVWRLELDVTQHYIAFAVIGFMYGVVFPSRELLVRAATPKGASGRVFGLVYSGMDFGSATSPVLFGWFIDTGIPRSAYLCVAIMWAVSIAIMVLTSAATRRRGAVAAE
ncbi:MAG: MFS transporter [Rhodospirillales bacterium]|jgi:predicted MFS family arabinose efflux permease|nr:MFS transporter [Rhodospirillales bacterium]MDP6773262.1 MFS transporter [Rhodospirillales bacterium]